MDDERLKQGATTFGKDYFKELLDRVRSIRANVEYTNKSQIYLQNVVLIIIQNPK